MMMHSVSGGGGGTVADIQIQAKEMIRINDKLTKIMALHTGQSVSKVKKDEDRDFWMDAEQAVDYGLVDQVIYPEATKKSKKRFRSHPKVIQKQSEMDHKVTPQ